ncbi:3-hydroxyacyl-CoA dehydrogenase NAD-binding domain-containing protein [Gallaecimonas kandeliae]|uniref:3-hydroxyacyl-CoA dehydrogenase family protein n=1 Tax=Gallaecimonas kandeliae TaxID=3029055 RepID=UPI002649D007|nr:3-hydroxyacyl-CoA dehydrogenase NAD-binding domain-containing protein [Gallaecimonas kandeliae]WKE66785.1 3-hydroxyacyl-CoA dehydrogenase NAD-binding domain-containing protein [Gallaecimonas kandeliae]
MFNNVLIIGGGTMGSGVSALMAVHGIKVTLLVRKESNHDHVASGLQKSILRLIRKLGLSNDLNMYLDNIRIVSSLPNDTTFDLVFEAIKESLADKKSLIENFSSFVDEKTIWATNTSSLSVTDLSSSYPHPSRFIGLHFFNPVSSMELIEVIPSMLTDEDTYLKVVGLGEFLGKKSVKVEDSPGFIVNRLLIPMINEAVILLENKVAAVDEIDSAMTLGAHHPLGPLALADLIGNDVCLSIMDALYNTTRDTKYRASYLLRKMVSANRLGRKTGHGFYNY